MKRIIITLLAGLSVAVFIPSTPSRVRWRLRRRKQHERQYAPSSDRKPDTQQAGAGEGLNNGVNLFSLDQKPAEP